MPRDDRRIFITYLAVLFLGWPAYDSVVYRELQRLPHWQFVAWHETARAIAFAGLPLYWAFRKTRDPLSSLGLRFTWRSLAVGLGLGLAYAAACILIGVELQGRRFHPRFSETSFWLGGFSGAVVVEELGFRSFLLGVLRFQNPTLGLLSSAGFFALVHAPGWWILRKVTTVPALLAQLAPIFLLGCILAVVFRRTHSLYAVVLIHALNNSAAAALG